MASWRPMFAGRRKRGKCCTDKICSAGDSDYLGGGKARMNEFTVVINVKWLWHHFFFFFFNLSADLYLGLCASHTWYSLFGGYVPRLRDLASYSVFTGCWKRRNITVELITLFYYSARETSAWNTAGCLRDNSFHCWWRNNDTEYLIPGSCRVTDRYN